MGDYQEYEAVPVHVQGTFKDGLPVKPEGALVWTGAVEPPLVGERIRVTMNGLGTAVVVGYFSQDGFLGLRTLLDSPPDWYLRQNGGNVVGHIFGPEFKPVNFTPDGATDGMHAAVPQAGRVVGQG